MQEESLKSFLAEANQAGYAAEDTREWIKEQDGSLTILYKKGVLSYHDNFFGGDPFGGRIVVSQDSQPKWMMVYYGFVSQEIEANLMFQFLRKALKQMPADIPLRGPTSFTELEMEYLNKWSGTLERYQGSELILRSGKKVYQCTYQGGWVDRRSAL